MTAPLSTSAQSHQLFHPLGVNSHLFTGVRQVAVIYRVHADCAQVVQLLEALIAVDGVTAVVGAVREVDHVLRPPLLAAQDAVLEVVATKLHQFAQARELPHYPSADAHFLRKSQDIDKVDG